MNIVQNRKIFYTISGILFLISIISLSLWGLKLGIDFTGGSLMEVEYIKERPEFDIISKIFSDSGIQSARMQGIGERGALMRFRDISETEHSILLSKLAGNIQNPSDVLIEKRFDSVGPVIGRELKESSVKALLLVLILIVLYIAFAFRKVSLPISSWKYGIVALAALMHDVLIPAGIFSILGKFMNIEVDILFITGLLTVLGFSVHDTIVVFDRVREKLKMLRVREDFAETVQRSVRETFARSINTSFTVVIALLPVFLLGGESTRYLSLLLIIGVLIGTYSSIFIASPLLVTWELWQRKR
ncbi:MAG: protein translocase subunit SecF [Patescibacteria group bacterium]